MTCSVLSHFDVLCFEDKIMVKLPHKIVFSPQVMIMNWHLYGHIQAKSGGAVNSIKQQ